MSKPRRRLTKKEKINQDYEKINSAEDCAYKQKKIIFGPIKARNEKQQSMLRFLDTKRIVLALGPAGTGKTFLATSWAAEKLQSKEIDKIVIVRPAVGCEEDLGAVPGTEDEKFAAWTQPFMDVFFHKLGRSTTEYHVKFHEIDARPLQTMRGSTFRNSVVILDEAQNTTAKQMEMFLTRIGEGSSMIIVGDIGQSDLPKHLVNGLKDAFDLFHNAPEIGVVEFTEDEVVRDPLTKMIVKAYRARALRETERTERARLVA